MRSEYLDLFDGYFSGRLEEQQRLELENRLKIDDKTREAFQEYRDLRNGIDYSIMKTLKEELQKLEASLPEVDISQKVETDAREISWVNRSVWWKAAAVVVILAVSTLIMVQLNQPTSPQDLFNQHFEPYSNEFVSAKRGDDIGTDPLVQAFQAYDREDYGMAIAGFNQILAEEEDIMVLFYLGNAQLAENLGAEAIVTFKRFLEISRDSVSDAKWYLALSYLKEDRIEDASAMLEDLKQDTKYGKDATKMLRRFQ